MYVYGHCACVDLGSVVCPVFPYTYTYHLPINLPMPLPFPLHIHIPVHLHPSAQKTEALPVEAVGIFAG